MGGDLELGPFADPLDRPLQRWVGEWDQPPAALADHVVVMPAGVVALEGDTLTPDIDPVHQVQLLELLQRPVDAGSPYRRQPPIDLQGRQRTALALQQFDHLTSSCPGFESCLVESLRRSLGPSHREEST